MEYQNNFEIKEYLNRFDQILCEMESKMLAFNLASNITINFITCMIPYHEMAIEMSENILTYTNSKTLYEIANNIIEINTREIEQIREIKRTEMIKENLQNDVTNYEDQYLKITKNMINKMKNSPRCQNIDIDFIEKMIIHHEGAVEMCNSLLQYPINGRLRLVVNSIIQEQTKEIQELKSARS